MAIIEGGTSAVQAEVGSAVARPVHVVLKPQTFGSLGVYSLGMKSGIMAAALAANSEIFQFRWPDATNFALVHRVTFDASANVAAGAVAQLSVAMTAARGWSAAGSGGTRATLTGNNAKLRTSMGTSLVNDAGISTTAALTAGTKTLDTANLAEMSFNILTGAVTTQPTQPLVAPGTQLWIPPSPAHPLVHAQNEGFVIRNGATAWPAGATWSFAVTVMWSEVAAY